MEYVVYVNLVNKHFINFNEYITRDDDKVYYFIYKFTLINLLNNMINLVVSILKNINFININHIFL